MKIQTGYIALAVADIKESELFYSKIGFRMIDGAGSIADKWLLMENGNAKIGLFEGMFPKNTITFNSDETRKFYAEASENGISFQHASESIKDENGPCSFLVTDPDGNPILFDQHA